MFAALDRQNSILHGGFSLTAAVEAFLDPLIVVACLLACAAAFDERLGPPYVILATLAFSLTFPGNIGFHEHWRTMMRKLLTNWLMFIAVLGAFGVVSGYLRYFPQSLLLVWAAATPFVLLAGHALLRLTLPRVIAIGGNRRVAVVAGINEIGIQLVGQFRDNPYLATRVIGFFDDRSSERLPVTNGAPTLGGISELAAFVKRRHADAIYLTLPMASQPRILALLDDLKDTTGSIYFVPDIFVTDLIQGRMDHVGGLPVVAVCETPFTGVTGAVKRISDIALATLILIVLLPVMLVLAAGVKLSSPGPVIFRQRRYGLDGREIVVYKFRSMTTADDGAVVEQATRADPRVTPFGGFIRRTSLDELPQFVNVLQGRMSVVGPRPHAVAHNETYRKLIKGYMVRHKVKPGITGWAQVSGHRGQTDTVTKMQKRIECDLEYLRNWSLGLDLWIIIKTARLVLMDRNAY